ncbi:DUF5658 family protein [Rosistilla ulvae]|nr:DUF5658 family protein [Rosistilla ulvae]
MIEAAFRRKEAEYQADPGSDPWDFQQVKEAYQTLRKRDSATLRTATSATTKPPSPSTLAAKKEETIQSDTSVPPRPFDRRPPEPESAKNPPHLVWQAFFRELPLQQETTYFLLANLLDIFMTYGLLKFGGIETNPIANYFLQRWGFDGMIALKMGSVAFVVVVVQQIAVRDLTKARRLLIAGTAIVFAVVVYSGVLLSRILR